VAYSAPRILIGIVESKAIGCVIVSAHAPHGDKQDTIDWWIAFGKILQPYLSRTMIMGIDANIDFNQTHSPNVGCITSRKKKNSVCEQLFSDILRRHGLIVPSTFEHLSRNGERQATFIARRCATVNDYVAVSSNITVHDGSAMVWDSFDTGGQADDHVPAAITCSFPNSNSVGIRKRRVVPYCADKNASGDKILEMKSALAWCPK
jgi:hypothetical protein